MNHPEQMRAAVLQVLDQIRGSANWDDRMADQDNDPHARRLLADVKRHVADLLAGAPITADRVTADGTTGMRIGPFPFLLPQGATLEQKRAHCDLLQALHTIALRQLQHTRLEVTAERSTLTTAQLDPADLPQPDPLSASPAEESSARREPEQCTECETTGRNCLAHGGRPGKVRDIGRHLGERVVVAVTGGVRAHGVLAEVSGGTLVLDPHEDGPRAIPVGDVEQVTPLPPRAETGIWKPGPDGRLVNILKPRGAAGEGEDPFAGPGNDTGPYGHLIGEQVAVYSATVYCVVDGEMVSASPRAVTLRKAGDLRCQDVWRENIITVRPLPDGGIKALRTPPAWREEIRDRLRADAAAADAEHAEHQAGLLRAALGTYEQLWKDEDRRAYPTDPAIAPVPVDPTQTRVDAAGQRHHDLVAKPGPNVLERIVDGLAALPADPGDPQHDVPQHDNAERDGNAA